MCVKAWQVEPFLLSKIPNSKAASATSSFIGLNTESQLTIDAAGFYSLRAFLGRLTRNGKRKWLVALLLLIYIGGCFIVFLYKYFEDYRRYGLVP